MSDFLTRIEDGVAILEIQADRLTHRDTRAFSRALAEAAALGDQRVVLDLSRTDYVDASAFGTLTLALKKALELGGEIRLAALRLPVQILVELMRLHRVFDVHPSVDDALFGLQVSGFDTARSGTEHRSWGAIAGSP